ncbi:MULTISPECIES: phage tail protein [unclassified Carboxylicivirga]|uniref:phage tail protein n=1 Tax=Carboxylicivirga TaxID=1628153 RepID=UPI003D32F74F
MKKIVLAAMILLATIATHAQSEGMIGEIRMFAGNFAPRGWALCDGQLLSIAQNSALFSILGTTYGGDGRTTFALPDLRGRVPVHAGSGPGLSPYALGQKGGAETTTLSVGNLPAHSHNASVVNKVNNDEATSDDPSGKYPAVSGENMYHELSNAESAVSTVMVENTGEGQAFDQRQPYATINYIICLQGIYPSRN